MRTINTRDYTREDLKQVLMNKVVEITIGDSIIKGKVIKVRSNQVYKYYIDERVKTYAIYEKAKEVGLDLPELLRRLDKKHIMKCIDRYHTKDKYHKIWNLLKSQGIDTYKVWHVFTTDESFDILTCELIAELMNFIHSSRSTMVERNLREMMEVAMYGDSEASKVSLDIIGFNKASKNTPTIFTICMEFEPVITIFDEEELYIDNLTEEVVLDSEIAGKIMDICDVSRRDAPIVYVDKTILIGSNIKDIRKESKEDITESFYSTTTHSGLIFSYLYNKSNPFKESYLRYLIPEFIEEEYKNKLLFGENVLGFNIFRDIGDSISKEIGFAIHEGFVKSDDEEPSSKTLNRLAGKLFEDIRRACEGSDIPNMITTCCSRREDGKPAKYFQTYIYTFLRGKRINTITIKRRADSSSFLCR